MNHTVRYAYASMVLIFVNANAWADHVAQHKRTDSLDVYYGVVPEQVVREHIREHAASPMHKKSLPSKGEHHLVVTLYDAKTEQRIANARVKATVAELGLNAQTKPLEPMKINNAVSYGNYFTMPSKDSLYQIEVSISRPAEHSPAIAKFEHRHAVSR